MFSTEKNYLNAKQAVTAILEGKEEEVLRFLYRHLLSDFIRFADHKYQVKDVAYADEILIQVLTIFWEKVIARSFPELGHASLKTYLFTIGANKILDEQKKALRRQANPLENHLSQTSVDIDLSWDDQLEFRDLLKKSLQPLTPKCQEILTYSLLNRSTLEEISDKMSYKDVKTAASAHSRCLAHLKESIKQLLNKEQLSEILNKLRL